MITTTDPETGEPFRLFNTPELRRDLDAWYADDCKHLQQTVVRATVANGAVQYRHQCVACAELVGSAIAKSAAPRDAPAHDVALMDRHAMERKIAYGDILETHVLKQKHRDNEWWQKYTAYLKTPAWHARRAKVMKRANNLCEGCRDRPATEVHHLTYEHVCEEFLFELVALCDACHERIHRDDEPPPS